MRCRPRRRRRAIRKRTCRAAFSGALVICTLLYIAVAAVLTGLVPYHNLNVSDPIAKGVDVIGLTWFSVLIKIGALTGLTTVILVLLYGQSRIFYTMAHDGLLPGLFSKIHPKLQTPYLSQMMIGSIVALVAAFVPISVLGEMVSIGTLLAFVLGLRRGDLPAAQRRGRASARSACPACRSCRCSASPSASFLMIALPLLTWARLVVWLAIGLAIYYFYGRKHSAMRGKASADKIAA